MPDDNLSTNSNLPESPRSALSEIDQNMQKESQSSPESEIKGLKDDLINEEIGGQKQTEDQINREIGGQNQTNKEAVEKFLTGS
ncbi:11843_t:CDS:1, partial [Dentiscutata heterogama]